MIRHILGAAAALSVLLAVSDATGNARVRCSRSTGVTGFLPPPLYGLRSVSVSTCSRVLRDSCGSAKCLKPQARRSIHLLCTATATAGTSKPASWETVDPFLGVQPDMRRLKQKIKAVIERKLGSGDKTHPLLKSSSREFFERSEKTWRPMVALLLSKALSGTPMDAAPPPHHDDAMVIAEIVEIMHTSTVIHDTVLEDYEAFEKGNMAHRIYSSSIAGNKVSILAGDFLLSRASVLLSSLRNTNIVEIMAGALEAIMIGQMQLHRPIAMAPVGMHAYVSSLQTRTGNLLSCGCVCAAMVAGYERDGHIAQAAGAYGMNLGVAYQIVKDLHITEANYDKLFNKMQAATKEGLGSGGMAPLVLDPYELNEPLQRAGALMYAVDEYPQLSDAARGGFTDLESLLNAREMILACNANDAVRSRAARHRDAAIAALAPLPDSDSKLALINLAHCVTEANQKRLQRVNYDADGVYTAPADAAPKTGTQLTRVLDESKKGAKMGMFRMRARLQDTWSQVSAQVQLAKDKLKGDSSK